MKKQLFGLVPTINGVRSKSELREFLQELEMEITDTFRYEEGVQMFKIQAPPTEDSNFQNLPLASVRRNSRLVKCAGILHGIVMETGELTVELDAVDKAEIVEKHLPPYIQELDQEGNYFLLKVRPEVGEGIHRIAEQIGKIAGVKYVNVEVFPSEFLKEKG